MTPRRHFDSPAQAQKTSLLSIPRRRRSPLLERPPEFAEGPTYAAQPEVGASRFVVTDFHCFLPDFNIQQVLRSDVSGAFERLMGLFREQKSEIELYRVYRRVFAGSVVPGLQEKIDRLFADREDPAEPEANRYLSESAPFKIIGPNVVGQSRIVSFFAKQREFICQNRRKK